MLSSVWRLLVQYSRFLLVRVILFAMFALLAVAASLVFGGFIPDRVSGFIGEDAMNTIVNTLASSMLAVTTFSLSIMAAAYQSAAGAMTPRSRLVLRQDSETQRVLSSFVGAFVFSLVVIILRATPLIGEKERFLLFCATVLVVLIVLVAIISWIKRLETLGANDDTVRKLEESALDAMRAYSAEPACGAHILTKEGLDEMRGKPCVRAKRSGYVQQILETILQEEAEQHDLLLHVAVRTGDYVVEGQALAYCDGMDEANEAKLRAAFYIQQNRSFEQDPMLGVQVLTEVASRALSPAVNDPQTAVDVINRLSAVFLAAKDERHDQKLRCSRVWIIPQDLGEMFAASYHVIARDGGEAHEIKAALRASLERIRDHGSGAVVRLARQTSERLKLTDEN